MKKIHSIILLSALLLTGCKEKPEAFRNTIYGSFVDNGHVYSSFNTYFTLSTYYKSYTEDYCDLADSEMIRMHKLFDRHYSYSNVVNLTNINSAYQGDFIEVDNDLYDLIKTSIEMCELTEGYFNPCMGVLASYWEPKFIPSQLGFNPDPVDDPDATTLNQMLSTIPSYTNIRNIIELNEENKSVKFNKIEGALVNPSISLGGIAKGYAVEKIVNQFNKSNPFMLSGGGSSIYINGENPLKDGGEYYIGLINPDYPYSSIPFLTSSYKDSAVISISGDYQQYTYNQDGVRRHHILNPYTGFSENYYRTMCVASNSRADILDALSTALYNINSDTEIKRITHNVEEYYGIDIDIFYIKEENDNLVVHADQSSKDKFLMSDEDLQKVILIDECSE